MCCKSSRHSGGYLVMERCHLLAFLPSSIKLQQERCMRSFYLLFSYLKWEMAVVVKVSQILIWNKMFLGDIAFFQIRCSMLALSPHSPASIEVKGFLDSYTHIFTWFFCWEETVFHMLMRIAHSSISICFPWCKLGVIQLTREVSWEEPGMRSGEKKKYYLGWFGVEYVGSYCYLWGNRFNLSFE